MVNLASKRKGAFQQKWFLALVGEPVKRKAPPVRLVTERLREVWNSRKMVFGLLSRFMGRDSGEKGKGEEPESKAGNRPEPGGTPPVQLQHEKVIQNLKERVEARKAEEKRNGGNQSAGAGAGGGLLEPEPLNTMGTNRATIEGEPGEVTPGAEPKEQEREEVTEGVTKGTLIKEVSTEGSWACRGLNAVSDSGMGTGTAEWECDTCWRKGTAEWEPGAQW